MNERRIIYALLCCGCVTISFNVAAIAAAIPAISLDLKLPDFLVARIIPFYMIPYGVGALFYAPLTKRISYKLILSVSLAGYAAASLYCASIHSIEHFLIGRVGMGLMGASAIPLGLIIIGQLFEKNVRGRLVGLFFSFSFFASIAGILISGVSNWRWLFYIPAIIGGITSLCIVFLQSTLLQQIHGARVDYLKAFQNIKIRRLFIFIFVISFLYHGVHKWFGVYLNRVYDLDKFVISVFFIIAAVSGAVGQLFGGYLSDKKGRYCACLIGILILSCATMLLCGRYPLAVLAGVLSLVAMGWTIGHNGVSTVLTDFQNYRPEIASLNSSVRFMAGGLGFYVSSLFVEKSFGLTFLGIGVLMLITSFFVKKVIPE